MKVKAENGLARILKAEGIPWVSCYPTSNVNNALGEEGVPILMMGEERFAVAVADAFSRVTCGKQNVIVRNGGMVAEPDQADYPCSGGIEALPEPQCSTRELWRLARRLMAPGS